MPTLNQIGDFIAYRVNRPNDRAVKNQAKLLAKTIRSRESRRSLERARHDRQLLQRIQVELIKVDKADSCFIDIGCTIRRTKNKVPKPIRWKTDAPFIYVGQLVGNNSFTYTDLEELRYAAKNKFTSKVGRYYYINDYIYVVNQDKLKWIDIHSQFDDPDQIINLCDNNACYNDDMEFPVTNDILHVIIREILTVEFKMPAITDDEIKFD